MLGVRAQSTPYLAWRLEKHHYHVREFLPVDLPTVVRVILFENNVKLLVCETLA